MKTILVATDYSRSANNALEYAAALAKGMEARLVLFNAFDLSIPPSAAPLAVPNIEELLRYNNERITRLGNKIAEAYGLVVDCITSTDLALNGLLKQAKKQQADLIIMGMKGHLLLTKYFGSITTAVIKKNKYPVLVIPEDAGFRGLRRILFACDYTHLSKSSRLEPIQELATAYKAQVQILHVEKEEEFLGKDRKPMRRNAPNMEEVLTGIKHSYRFLQEEHILEGIERGIDEFHADLVVMVPHKKDFWEAIFHPSLTIEMALHSHVPLLALPNLKKIHQGQKAVKPVNVTA